MSRLGPDHDRRRAGLALRFAGMDPITAPGDIATVRDAIRYVSDDTVDAEVRLLWARWAYQRTALLCGPADPDRLVVSCIYRQVLSSQGLTFDVVAVCAQSLHAVHIGDPRMIQTAQHALAQALHHDGQCRDALHLAASLIGDEPQYIVVDKVIISLAGMFAGCGLTRTARRLLHRNATSLRLLGVQQLTHEAKQLAYIEAGHPATGCERRSPQPEPADIGDRIAFWRSQLDVDHLTAGPPR
jgi:hypothetical protein